MNAFPKNVWRIQLKPDKKKEITYQQLLKFCDSKGIIGVGWTAIKNRSDTEKGLWEDCQQYNEDGKGGATRAYKALHAMYQMEEGDLIWTRLGEDASDYYLCRVGKTLWKDCIISEDDQNKYDIGNAVSAQWIPVGKQNMVPGKVLNSFIPAATVQRVRDATKISTILWNELSSPESPKYPDVKLTIEDFWDSMIDSEELECLVLLYLQTKGYYLYSSTTKRSNPKYEGVMISHDGSHLAFPQIKRNLKLDPAEYAMDNKKDKVFLFSSSEDYGDPVDNVVCISRDELYSFATEHRELLTDTARRLLDKIS